MPTFRAIPREQTIRAWREWARERSLEVRAEPAINGETVRLLAEEYGVEAMGRTWLIPPVPVPDAIRVQELMDRLEELRTWELAPGRRGEAREEYAVILLTAIRLVPRLVRPVGRVARLLWPVRWRLRNPFRRASEADLVELLLGFSMRRRMGPDRHAHDSRGPEGTTSRGSARLPGTFRPGAGRTGFRYPGGTTFTGSRFSSETRRGRN